MLEITLLMIPIIIIISYHIGWCMRYKIAKKVLK